MNKKLLSLVMTGVLAVGVFSVATPYEVQARKTKPETSTDITIKRAPGQSVVMTMSELVRFSKIVSLMQRYTL